jgi:FKBP-type peptidyl-prolyl cis-trans isomerase
MFAWSMRGLTLAGFVAFHVSTASPAVAQPAPPDERPPADVARPPKDARPSASGLVWKILRPGHGPERAARNDCVSALYTIWKRDGTVLGSSRTWSQSGKTCLRAMIPGMAEAVKRMAPGERRRIWIPAHLGYDDDDKAKSIDLTVDFELLEIQKAPPIPVDLKSPPASATKLESGVCYRRIKKGGGSEHPSSKTQMLLDFSGWTLNGDLIESTVMAGHPASFELISALRGWREVLQLMVVGDKVRIWIPAALAFGDKPRRGQPKGDLVYELELLAFH